jgi:hypothetical protein
MSDIGRQIEQGSDGPEWEQYRRPSLTKCEAAELDRLRDAVAYLRGHVRTPEKGEIAQHMGWCWLSVWQEFERRVDG